MKKLVTYRSRGAVLGALTLPIAVSAAFAPWRRVFPSTGVVLVLIVVVLTMAVVGTRLAGVVASVSSAIWFDFFLTRPYFRFAISHRLDVESTVSIVVVGCVVTELAARSRHHAHASHEEGEWLATACRLTELSATSPRDEIVESTSSALVSLLNLRECHFVAGDTHSPRPRIVADGEVVHVGLVWPVDDLGIPGPEAEILANWRGRTCGRFVMTPSPGQPVAAIRRSVAVALATMAAAALSETSPVAR